jgi:hypothetical protein
MPVASPPHNSAILRGLGGRVYGGICPSEGSLLEAASAKRIRGGVAGLIGVVGAGVAGRMGTGLIGCVYVQDQVPFPMTGDIGEMCVCAGVRLHVARMLGIEILWIRSWLRNASRPFFFTSSTGHLAGER